MDGVGDHVQGGVVDGDGVALAVVGAAPFCGPGDFLARVADLSLGAEAAVHQDLRQLAAVCQGGGVGGVDGLQRLAGRQVAVIDVRPGGGVALLGGDVGETVQALAVGKGHGLHQLPVGLEGQFHLGEGAGGPAGAEGREGHGGGLACVADAVDAAETVVGEGVAGDDALGVPLPGDGACVGLRVGDLHGRAAVFQVRAVACDAADIMIPREGAAGPALPDGAPGAAGDAANVAAVGAGDGAVVFAVGDLAQVHAAHHAPSLVLLAGDGAVVHGAADDGLGLVGDVQRAVPFFDQIVLRVEIVLDGHGPSDARHVHVALNLAVVGAGGDAAGALLVAVDLVGDVLHQVLVGLVLGVLGLLAEQVGDGLDLVADGGQVRQDVVRRAADHVRELLGVVDDVRNCIVQLVALGGDVAADGGKGDGRLLSQGLDHGVQVFRGLVQESKGFVHGVACPLECVNGVFQHGLGVLQNVHGVLEGISRVVQGVGGSPEVVHGAVQFV